ncbi:hypothetical protein [Thiofaba sp. EF100]|uniref:hypothetical protein n=1 Tax=Thiofaba sp. EF100 TaxID=3121274 RepID=UPI003221687C
MIGFILVASALTLGLLGLRFSLRHKVASLRHPGLVWLMLLALYTLAILALAQRTLGKC